MQDCELLGLKPLHGRPEEFLWQYISVPPVCIRPSVAQDGASNEDDLTVKLTEIVFTSALIRQGLLKGAPTQQFMVCAYFTALDPSNGSMKGTMGFPAVECRNLRQLRTAWCSSSDGTEAYSWILPTVEGQARSFPWKFIWKTS